MTVSQDKKSGRKTMILISCLVVIFLILLFHAGRFGLMIRQWNNIFVIGFDLPPEQTLEWVNPSITRSILLPSEVPQQPVFDLQNLDLYDFSEKFAAVDYEYAIDSPAANWQQLTADQRQKVLDIFKEAGLNAYEKSFRKVFVDKALEGFGRMIPWSGLSSRPALRLKNMLESSNHVRKFGKLVYTFANMAMREGDHQSALEMLCSIHLIAFQFESENYFVESLTKFNSDGLRRLAASGILDVVDSLELSPDEIRRWITRLQNIASCTPTLSQCLNRECEHFLLMLASWNSEYPCILTNSLNSVVSRKFLDDLHQTRIKACLLPYHEATSEAARIDASYEDFKQAYYLDRALLLKNFFYSDAIFIRAYAYYEQPIVKLANLVEQDYEARRGLSLSIAALALRAWQIEYGRMPDSLKQVESWLGAALPGDPKTGSPFPYNASATSILINVDVDDKRITCFSEAGEKP